MKVWLVTWDGTDETAIANKIAAILPARWPERRVADFVEFLYAAHTSTVGELARYAARPTSNPYRAQIERQSHIHCGHNPHLSARLFSDLEVIDDTDTGIETITWLEPPSLRLGEADRVEVVTPPRRASAQQRRVRGKHRG